MSAEPMRKTTNSIDTLGLEAAWPGAMFSVPRAGIAGRRRLGRAALIGLACVALAGLGAGFLLWHFVAGLPA